MEVSKSVAEHYILLLVVWCLEVIECEYRSLLKIRLTTKIRPLPFFAESYCKGSFITRKYAHRSGMCSDEIRSVCVD